MSLFWKQFDFDYIDSNFEMQYVYSSDRYFLFAISPMVKALRKGFNITTFFLFSSFAPQQIICCQIIEIYLMKHY